MTFQITKISTYQLNQTSLSASLRIQQQMSEAQRQLSTGTKEVDFAGYGVQSLMIQEYRAELESRQGYIDNINVVETQINQMNRALEQLYDQLEIVIGQASIDPQEGTPDTEAMHTLANNAREIMIDLLNTKIGDRYLFAGADVTNAPYENASDLDTRVSRELADWLDQTNTASDFLTNIDNLTQSQQGYSLTIQSATNIRARVADNYEVDYTVKANQKPFQDILKALTVFTQLDVPDPTTDLATREEFYEIQNAATSTIIQGINDLRSSSLKLSNAAQAINSQRETHIAERAQLLTLMENTESVDTAEAITRFQSLSVQLEASFRATSIIQNMSLARFL
jgi:flagellin-like hook-associated protein FlgL